MRTVTQCFDGDVDAPARARHFVRGMLDTWHCPALPDAELLVSELMTNAVVHAHCGAPVLRMYLDHHLRVEVHDDEDDGPVAISDPTPDAVGGLGLKIVDRLAHSWGTQLDGAGPGKAVWFELDVDPSVHQPLLGVGSRVTAAGSTSSRTP